MTLARLTLLGTLVAAACGPRTPPPPPGTGPPTDSPISVFGTERIGWDQTAADSSEIARYQYIAYVDDVPQPLANATCQGGSSPTTFSCSASLPTMAIGLHRLQLTAKEIGELQRESAKSPVLTLLVVAPRSTSQTTPKRITTSDDGDRFALETLATGLDASSALAVTPDGRVFIARRSGNVVVWQGRLRSAPAVTLADAVRTGEVGSIDMTLHPDYPANGRVYVAYTALDDRGEFVNRIVRFRDVDSVFGEAAVLLEDRVTAAPQRPPRIRFGPDRKIYVAFSAPDRATAESSASYAGKILRINEDGTTPRENPRSSPVISNGHGLIAGFDWQLGTNRLWLAEQDWQRRNLLRAIVFGGGGLPAPAFRTMLETVGESQTVTLFSFDAATDASGMVFWSHSSDVGSTEDLVVATLAGGHLRRVHFDSIDSSRVQISERLLEGQIGSISDIVQGPDGALYLCTANRGSGSSGDDRLLKLVRLYQ